MAADEKEVYEPVENWLRQEKGCIVTRREGDPLSSPVTFKKFKTWKVDVAGRKGDFTYAVEVKNSFDFYSLSGALWQAGYYQHAFNFVYICFPFDRDIWGKGKKDRENKELLELVSHHSKRDNIGILLHLPEVSSDGRSVIIATDNYGAQLEVDTNKLNTKIDFELYHQVRRQLTYSLEFYTYESRAILVKDLCKLVQQIGQPITQEKLEVEFEQKAEYHKTNSLAGLKLKQAKVERKGKHGVNAAIQLGLLMIVKDHLMLTKAGEVLANIVASENLWNSITSEQKDFFYLLLLQYDEVRLALDRFRDKKGTPSGEFFEILDEELGNPSSWQLFQFGSYSGILPFKFRSKNGEWFIDYDES